MHLSCPQCHSTFLSIATEAGRCPRCGAVIPSPARGPVAAARIAPPPQNVALQPVASQPRSIPVGALLAVALVLAFLTVGSGAVVTLVLFRGPGDKQAKANPADEENNDLDRLVVTPTSTKQPEAPKQQSKVVKRQPRRELILPGNAGEFEIGFMTSMAKGRRFVIIADRSGSMGNGLTGQILQLKSRQIQQLRRPIDVLYDELEQTIRSIKRGGKYHVIYYSDSALPMPFGDPWMEGQKNIDQVINWVRSIGPDGGTNPLPAFRLAFDLDPLPDVIFFMTDGRFPYTVADQVKFLNDRHGGKVKINTIQFSLPRLEPNGLQLIRNRTLERIAEDSGGEYTLYTGKKQP